MTSQRMAWIGASVVFLLFCGWKLTLGLEHVLDLRLGDETKYLSYALGYDAPDNPAQWSPLYVALYRLEHVFISDPIDLYFFHQKLVAILLPVCVFIYLASRRVPFVIALIGAGYFMISAANLPVEPKTMHVALAGMFLCLALFVGLGQHPARWGLMPAAAALLSFVRPEFAIAFLGFAVYVAYLVVTARDWRLTASVLIGLICAVALYAYVGFPMWGGRTVFAFAQHFALNYGTWHNVEDPWTSDYQQIFQTVFPNLAAEVVEARAGLGAETPGRTPIVGPLPGYPEVYVAVPSTNGFLLSAVMADMLTALLMRGEQHPLLPMVLPVQAMQRTFA